ncbi:MAG: glycogen synthase GlgA, partial [Acidobacteriales bacterium]|nr:glycogen synthase GlgA [Terriglobales bacterium]
MRLLLASSEVHPFSKSGGLADMVAALAKSLGRAGHQVGLVTPLYAGILERFPEIQQFDWLIDLPLGAGRVQASVRTLQPSPGLTIYFIDHAPFYARKGLYGEAGRDYPDNAQRFIFFSKCVAQLARYLPWRPELVNVHDWQTGPVPILIQHQRLTDGWTQAPRTCFTIHNLAYQGNFPRAAYDYTNLPLDYYNPNGLEFHGYMSCMKAGIVYADEITTVSPRYAREITTEEYGCGLDGVLRQRQSSLYGILNGVDYEEWNTNHNRHLPHPYSARSLAGKAQTKADLQTELGLPAKANVPLFANITRLADQKGVDIQLGALEEMLSANMQFVLLGSGAPAYETAYRSLQRRHPGKVAVRLGYDHALSHRIEAGADFFLMPSRFEPCGLNQMYSLHYGTIPIVRVTGGLDDSVVDISQDFRRADGIKFAEYSVRALAKSIRKALVLFDSPKLLEHYR